MQYARLMGEPCQAVRPEGRARLNVSGPGAGLWCGQPARFIWLGLDPRRQSMTAAQRRKYIRSNLLMCWDCARELWNDLGWNIKAGYGRLERLDVVKYRQHCRACGSTVYVSWDPDPPGTMPGELAYCPRCGERASYTLDYERDFWEVMANDLATNGAVPPIQLVQMLYEEWPRNDRRFQRFYDYFHHQMHLFETTNELEVSA